MRLEKYLFKFSSTKNGLQETQIEKNRNAFGKNELSHTKRDSFIFILLKQFSSFFSVLLFISAGILFVLSDLVDFYIILAVIVINAVIESTQRYKSDSIFEAITKNVPFYSIVIRNGKKIKIESKNIVAGDVVLLMAGDKVPADMLLLETADFKVDESMLTGESKAVLKEVTSEVYSFENITDNSQIVFSGSHVLTGTAKALVVHVGNDTELGKLSQTLSTLGEELPIHKNLKRLSFFIFCIVVTLSTLVLIVGLTQGQSNIELFKITVALFVSAIPESLPVMLTLVLAYGFKRMSDKNVLVRTMQSLDVLGKINILALDKTGTITRNQMKVEKLYIPFEGEFYVTGEGYNPEGALVKDGKTINIADYDLTKKLLFSGFMSSNGSFEFDTEHSEWKIVAGDPTEVALLVLAQKLQIDSKTHQTDLIFKKNIPFSNAKMYHETIYELDGKDVSYISGAPEVLLKQATHILDTEGRVSPLSDDMYDNVHEKITEYSKKGYRTIASCCKNSNRIIFSGVFALDDSIRKDIFESVQAVQKRNIEIVIITGDQKDVALQIGQKIGLICDKHTVLTGEEISNLTDNQLKTMIKGKNIFARVTPQQKLKILNFLKNNGNVVAMTGDGVNDSLALADADIGIAMGTASSDVAKEASDIVLLDNKFGSIVYGIEEGKNIFANINKVILFLLSTNFAEMLIVVFCVILFLPLPFSAGAILWLNLVTDTFLVIGFAFERGAHHSKNKNNLVSKRDWMQIGYLSFVMTVLTLIVFAQFLDQGLVYAQSAALLTLIILQWFNVLNIKSGNSQSVCKTLKTLNPVFILGYIISVGLTFFAFNSIFMNEILRIQPISVSDWLYIFFIGSLIVWFEEVRKLVRFKK